MSLDHGKSRVYKSCISRCLIEKMYFALSKRYILSLYTPSIWKIRTLLNYNLAKRIFMLKLCWLYTDCLIKNLRLSMCYRSRQKKNNVSREKKILHSNFIPLATDHPWIYFSFIVFSWHFPLCYIVLTNINVVLKILGTRKQK